MYAAIAVRIILLFSAGMAMAYITPSLRHFLGDVYIGKHYTRGFIHDGYDWGAPHYWYFWMFFCLFVLSLINCIISIVKIVNKHY